MKRPPVTRNKAYYSKRQIRSLIANKRVIIPPHIQEEADKDFGWDTDRIKKAILKLPVSCCYKSAPRFTEPEILVDYYRADDIYGENIYTHFYVEDGWLIIDSFKER
ncbi:MAG: hypothetical protein GXP53_06495 [Deltaproteobacteria bacterium]|nr:hypothetical protein [Deltaproteobacteria bacterium]